MERVNASFTDVDDTVSLTTNSTRVVGLEWTKTYIIVALVCACILAANTVSFAVLCRTKRMNFTIKFLSLAVTFCDGAYVLIIMSSMILIPHFPDDFVLRELLTEAGRIAVSMSWVTVAMISVERAAILLWPEAYTNHVTRTRVVTGSAAVWTACSGCKLVTRYCIFPAVYRHADILKQTRETGYILTTVLGVCLTVCIVCYAAIFRIVQSQKRRIRALQVPASDTQIVRYGRSHGVWVICLAFVLCYLPVFASYLLRLGQEDGYVKVVVTGMSLLACAVNPVLYGWRFRECRYILVLMLAGLSPRLQARAETMRLSVFSIATTGQRKCPGRLKARSDQDCK